MGVGEKECFLCEEMVRPIAAVIIKKPDISSGFLCEKCLPRAAAARYTNKKFGAEFLVLKQSK